MCRVDHSCPWSEETDRTCSSSTSSSSSLVYRVLRFIKREREREGDIDREGSDENDIVKKRELLKLKETFECVRACLDISIRILPRDLYTFLSIELCFFLPRSLVGNKQARGLCDPAPSWSRFDFFFFRKRSDLVYLEWYLW